MRRAAALRALSSDHHTGLVLARRARHAVDAGPDVQAAAWQEVARRFYAELEPHFQTEEQGLLPALAAAGAATLVKRTLAEHRAMRGLIAEDRPDNLGRFAASLEAHIRFEEQELFETAQRLLPPSILGGLERTERNARCDSEPPGPG
jgi:hemerythrin-like domain-containing protein